MIAANLIPALQESFRDRGLRISEASPPVATFPAIHPDVGDIVVCDDGDEVTVYLGNFTHAHFGVRSSDADGSVVDREQHIVDDVLDFLDDVFTDRIEFYRGRIVGGHRPRGQQGSLSRMLFGRHAFVWSGPVPE